MFGHQAMPSLGSTNAMITSMLGSLSEGADLPAFRRTEELMSYDGKTATVEVSLRDASVRIYCKGRQSSIYDSLKPELCSDPDLADQLGMEAVSEMMAASNTQSEQERAKIMANLAKRPW